MRNGNIPVCLSLLFVVAVCTAAGISPLATQRAHIGPYQLLLSFYSLPRTEQLLNMTIQSTTPAMNLRFSQPVLTPAPGTDATDVHVTLSPDSDTPDVYDVNVTPPIRGLWLLHMTASGPAGSFAGDIPIDVLGPPAIPKEGIPMVRAIAQTKGKRASHKSASMRPDITEHRIRQVSAWIVLCLLLLAEFGLAWDRRWHDMVGRDQFWIPPHIMMYTGIAGAGLIALCVVLVDTLRYYQKKAGVDDSSTVNILWFFHAPLGFILLGIGMLIDAIAAPLDNYWHVLYGVDVTFWAPFHLMGHLGAVIGVLGIIYAFASEAAYERQVEDPSPRLLWLNGPEWGIVVLLAGFQEVVLPALTAFIPIVLGPVQLITYPLILVLAASLFPISLYLCIRKPGITLLMKMILWPLSLATETGGLLATSIWRGKE